MGSARVGRLAKAVASQRLPDEVVEETEERRGDPVHPGWGGWRHRSMEFPHSAGYLEDRPGCDVWLYDDSQAVSLYAALRSKAGGARLSRHFRLGWLMV